ncbi:MAG TPA: hypothetical protein VKJ07_22485, partial [Mycobacteriales bacterium]|nr:hypothetical protein [Mycobacteriales bacterium]
MRRCHPVGAERIAVNGVERWRLRVHVCRRWADQLARGSYHVQCMVVTPDETAPAQVVHGLTEPLLG